MIFQNVIVGTPLVEPWMLLSLTEEDFEKNDKCNTLFTSERFLPRIMVEAGLVKSVSEVRRNQPKLCVELNTLDCIDVKWGKRHLFIVIGQ